MSSKVHVNKPLSSRLIIELLDENPDLEEIECPLSLYKRTSRVYLDALIELGIIVSTVEHRGRPRVYDDDLKEKINDMINSGCDPEIIASKLHIDIKTVYYLSTKKLKPGPKSKYSKKTIQEIVDLRSEGTSVRMISSMLHIPVRTVYYLLDKNEEMLKDGEVY